MVRASGMDIAAATVSETARGLLLLPPAPRTNRCVIVSWWDPEVGTLTLSETLTIFFFLSSVYRSILGWPAE